VKRVVEMPGFWVLGIALLTALATLVLFLVSWGCAALGVSIEQFFERHHGEHWPRPTHAPAGHRPHLPHGILL
jgi:hypothetical protein